MWGRIAKAVDTPMVAESPGKIQQKQVDYMLKAILDCALPKGLMEKLSHKDTFTKYIAVPTLPKPAPVWPKTPNPSQTKQSSKVTTKPSLQLPLSSGRSDNRLMIRLGEESPHRNEHLFLLQKRANAILSPTLTIGKVAHVKTGLALVLAAGTTLQQLQEFSSKLAQTFGACRAEPNVKWAKYMVRDIPRHIKTLDGLTDVSISIAEEAFEIAIGMNPECGRWTMVKETD